MKFLTWTRLQIIGARLTINIVVITCIEKWICRMHKILLQTNIIIIITIDMDKRSEQSSHRRHENSPNNYNNTSNFKTIYEKVN